MRKKLPKHLSYDYRLNLDSFPTKQADRLPLKVIMPAIGLGLLMVFLGLFELMNGMYDPESYQIVLDETTRAPFFSHTTVDSVFMFLGVCVIISAIVCYIRYKKIFFNGKTFSVDFRGVFGENELFREFLRNYDGVRLRLEFFQFGIVNKNKYIVELVHRDPQKTIPLYISTDATGVYQIRNYYAKRLNMPVIFNASGRQFIKEVSELDKSFKDYVLSSWEYAELVEGEHPDYDQLDGKIQIYKDNSQSFIHYTRKADRTVVKPAGFSWDVWTWVGAFWVFFYLGCLGILTYNCDKVARMMASPTKAHIFFGVAFVVAVFLLGILFKKEKIVLRDNKIILVNKFLFLSKKDYINLNQIKDMQVAYDPSAERHYLEIITDTHIFTFGKALPATSLEWICLWIVYNLIKK